MKRRCAAALRWLTTATLVAVCGAAAAQTYPVKPIRFILQHAPGGFGDITARLVAQKMSASMGQQVIIDNRPSSGAIVAANIVAKAEPDGYTLLLTGSGTAASASLFKSLPYDVLKDFEQVSTMGFAELVLLTGPDSRFGSVADVLAFARQNPGKLNIGSNNIGSTQNLAAELFKSMAGIDAQVVPFKASSGLIAAVRGNEIQVAFEFLAPVIQMIKGNALKALAVGSSQRFAGLPGTPTVAESGIAGYHASSWNGVSVPAKTPRPIIDRLYQEFAAAVTAPDVKQKLQEMGIDATAYTPAQTRELMISDIAKLESGDRTRQNPPAVRVLRKTKLDNDKQRKEFDADRSAVTIEDCDCQLRPHGPTQGRQCCDTGSATGFRQS